MDFEVSSDLSLWDGRPVGVMNTSTISTPEIAKDPAVQGLVREISRWVHDSRAQSATGGMFDRQAYVPPASPWDQMRVARRAVIEDDIVAGVADVTQSVAFKGGLKWEASDPDDADIFNQLSADLNLDNAIRVMWRDNFAVDQFVCARMWGWKNFKVRGMTPGGNRRKKSVRVWAPTRLVMLDPSFVVPIGWGPLREDRLAWQISQYEMGTYQNVFQGLNIDPLMSAFFTGFYAPQADELAILSRNGVVASQLVEMNPEWVFRHCHTRPDYQMFPDLRLRSVFGLLDLKRQLLASDRAALVGAANYILLIRKGDKDIPAEQEELSSIRSQYNFMAKLPVIISDHRLTIDVIAPKLDFVLKAEAYETLDSRILMRTLGAFLPPSIRTFDAPSWTHQISAGIQDRRHMIKRTLEAELARAVVEHPRNSGVFSSKPSLVFTPRNVSLGNDGNTLQALLALRTQYEVSRDTMLEYLGLDEATEAQRMDMEKKVYDQIFESIRPYASPGAQPRDGGDGGGDGESPQVSGGRGGRPKGGGSSTKSPESIAAPKSDSGQPVPKESE